ncbi:hypothetical protein [Stenotrophomonas sp. PS02289]|uniref:prealbumin-like fold domain-containing protein n=1 Tax=Stenotrophomonas sp. PS02289 TaxID=2991422 RepID=UPI00249B6398|nr:hypothetical protein [Stenotrophomonas sp. PS02289]
MRIYISRRVPAWTWAVLILIGGWTGPSLAQTVQLAKISQGGVGTFTFSMVNLDGSSDSITTVVQGTQTPSASVFNVLDPGLAVSISETPAPGLQFTDASCVDNSGQTPGPIGDVSGGATLIIPTTALLPGAVLVCTFINTAQVADLAISKTALPSVVPSGGTVTYTLAASNVGTVDVTDALLADSPGTGLSCTSPGSCTSNGGAVCPGSIPAGSLTGGGVTIPSMPAGSAVEVTFACTVTATGR